MFATISGNLWQFYLINCIVFLTECWNFFSHWYANIHARGKTCSYDAVLLKEQAGIEHCPCGERQQNTHWSCGGLQHICQCLTRNLFYQMHPSCTHRWKSYPDSHPQRSECPEQMLQIMFFSRCYKAFPQAWKTKLPLLPQLLLFSGFSLIYVENFFLTASARKWAVPSTPNKLLSIRISLCCLSSGRYPAYCIW